MVSSVTDKYGFMGGEAGELAAVERGKVSSRTYLALLCRVSIIISTYLALVCRVSMVISTGRPGDHQEEGVQVGGDDGLLGHLHDEVRILGIMYTW